MTKFTRDNYINKISNLTLNKLQNIPQKDLENLLQWIVDYKASSLGLPSMCKVKIRNLHINGKYNQKSHEIQIAKGLAVKLLKSPFDRTAEYNILAHKELFETLMHEFWHAAQQYARKHPECVTREQLEIIEFNSIKNVGSNIYFTILNTNDRNLKSISGLLYMLQPIERDAFIYANNESIEFNNLMREIYPTDESFLYHDSFSKFDKRANEAKFAFDTDTPFEDIDDIIRLLNGIDPNNEINLTMWQAVLDTQPHIKAHIIQHNIQPNIDIGEEIDIDREI